MFTPKEIDALFAELRKSWYRSPDWEMLNRHAHLGIASIDCGRSLNGIDPRVVALVEKHQPKE